jgi:hypothetical protein
VPCNPSLDAGECVPHGLANGPSDAWAKRARATDEELEKRLENISTAFSPAEDMKSVSLIKWRKQMGHPMMRVVNGMAKGAVTGMAMNDLPEKMPNLDDRMVCAMSKSKRLLFQTCRTRAKEVLESGTGTWLVRRLSNPVEAQSTNSFSWMIHRGQDLHCRSKRRPTWLMRSRRG